MTNLSSLIERIEAATGPDHEMDAAIELAFTDDRGVQPLAFFKHKITIGKRRTIPFTASIDAAMTLVPEGWLMAGLWERNTKLPNWRWKAELWSPDADRNVSGIARNSESPALALCAAALKARNLP